MEYINILEGLNTGKPWSSKEKAEWLNRQNTRTKLRAPTDELHRSYDDLVVARMQRMNPAKLVLDQYGTVDYKPPFRKDPYKLLAFRSNIIDVTKPTVVITGGVHGYETSGVMGVLKFAEEYAAEYADDFNLIIVPCVSPWSFETVNRLDYNTSNPNREGYRGTKSQEMASLMAYVDKIVYGKPPVQTHADCHDTTDTDRDIFRVERAYLEGKKPGRWMRYSARRSFSLS